MPNSKRGTESYAAPEITVGSLSKLFYRNAGIEHCDQGDINPIGVLYDAPFDLQFKIFRGEGTETAVAATLAAIRADVEAGCLLTGADMGREYCLFLQTRNSKPEGESLARKPTVFTE